MIADFEIKQYSTTPPLKATLTGDKGVPIDLTGTSVGFLMNDFRGEVKTTGNCVITNARRGMVEYQWQDEDTADLGQYEAEFVVSFGETTVRFPNSRNLIVEVVRALNEA
jgi:hypothetical protein